MPRLGGECALGALPTTHQRAAAASTVLLVSRTMAALTKRLAHTLGRALWSSQRRDVVAVDDGNP
ncbi:MAG: hypothetical protein GY708_10195 [Actinomycetia bacterium]|nr:hypothetical protein [Actinomycetes bacterium]